MVEIEICICVYGLDEVILAIYLLFERNEITHKPFTCSIYIVPHLWGMYNARYYSYLPEVNSQNVYCHW